MADHRQYWRFLAVAVAVFTLSAASGCGGDGGGGTPPADTSLSAAGTGPGIIKGKATTPGSATIVSLDGAVMLYATRCRADVLQVPAVETGSTSVRSSADF